jgi:hypothetical protein
MLCSNGIAFPYSNINFQYLLPNSGFIAGKTDAQIDKNSIERDKYSGRCCPGPQAGGLAHRFVLRVFIFRYILFQRVIRCVEVFN